MESCKVFFSKTEKETELIGIKLAKHLHEGDVVAVVGSLGAGKTAFVRGLAAGLGYNSTVKSASYTTMNVYCGGTIPIYHFDLSCFPSAEKNSFLELDDYCEQKGVCLIECEKRLLDLLPSGSIVVKLERNDLHEGGRNITVFWPMKE